MRSVLRRAAQTPVALASSPIDTWTKPGISLAMARSRILDSKSLILCIDRYISSSLSLPTSIARASCGKALPRRLQLVRGGAERQMRINFVRQSLGSESSQASVVRACDSSFAGWSRARRNAVQRAALTHRKSVGRRPPKVTPETVGALIKTLRRAAPSWNAPIVTLVAAHTRDPFQTLISCILSLRTKDETTAAASKRLFERASTPEAILKIPVRG